MKTIWHTKGGRFVLAAEEAGERFEDREDAAEKIETMLGFQYLKTGGYNYDDVVSFAETLLENPRRTC